MREEIDSHYFTHPKSKGGFGSGGEGTTSSGTSWRRSSDGGAGEGRRLGAESQHACRAILPGAMHLSCRATCGGAAEPGPAEPRWQPRDGAASVAALSCHVVVLPCQID